MCIFNDFRIKSAHDTCDGNGCVVVADHKSVFINVSLDAVKGLKFERSVESLDSDFFNLS